MNKYQKAWENIHRILEESAIYNMGTISQEDFDTIKELVDKATPLKQVIKDGRLYCAECSYCILIEDIWEMSYCCACGQKIDWGDEE